LAKQDKFISEHTVQHETQKQTHVVHVDSTLGLSWWCWQMNTQNSREMTVMGQKYNYNASCCCHCSHVSVAMILLLASFSSPLVW